MNVILETLCGCRKKLKTHKGLRYIQIPLVTEVKLVGFDSTPKTRTFEYSGKENGKLLYKEILGDF